MQIEKQALTPLQHATILGNVKVSDQNPVTSAAQGAQFFSRFKWHGPCLSYFRRGDTNTPPQQERRL
jgi:hypothetical protein